MAELDDTMRHWFYEILSKFDWDYDAARSHLRAAVESFERRFGGPYDEYCEEHKWKVKEIVHDQAGLARFVRCYDESALDVSIDDRVIIEVGFDKPDGTSYAGVLRHNFVAALKCAAEFTSREDVLASVGEFARNWFKLYAILHSNPPSGEAVAAVLDKMNEIGLEFHYEEKDARDAILGRGAFRPFDKTRTGFICQRLRRARKISEIGDDESAATIAGIKIKTNAELVKGLARELRGVLNNKLKLFDECDSMVGRRVLGESLHEITSILNEVQSEGLNEARLSEIVEVAVEKHWCSRPKTTRERIDFLLSVFENKLADNDFETIPEVEKPDVSDELGKLKMILRRMEKLLADLERDMIRTENEGLPTDIRKKYIAKHETMIAQCKSKINDTRKTLINYGADVK